MRRAFELLLRILWDRECITPKVSRPSIVTNADKLGLVLFNLGSKIVLVSLTDAPFLYSVQTRLMLKEPTATGIIMQQQLTTSLQFMGRECQLKELENWITNHESMGDYQQFVDQRWRVKHRCTDSNYKSR